MAERITGHTELIGLMAYPIRHSSSPAMQNEAFAEVGADYAYLAFEVGADEIEDAVKNAVGNQQKCHGQNQKQRDKQSRTDIILKNVINGNCKE